VVSPCTSGAASTGPSAGVSTASAVAAHCPAWQAEPAAHDPHDPPQPSDPQTFPLQSPVHGTHPPHMDWHSQAHRSSHVVAQQSGSAAHTQSVHAQPGQPGAAVATQPKP
jgi:hypothetical protein